MSQLHRLIIEKCEALLYERKKSSMTVANKNSGQKYLGEKGLIALITFLSAFVPLSTDLYLPALPGMAKYFNVSADLTNLTLILFFAFFAAGTLLWGPLSDKYGRKPILFIGLSIYSAASMGCVCSWNIHSLIAFRIFQAIGGSGAVAVAMAMIKDVYDSRSREPIWPWFNQWSSYLRPQPQSSVRCC